MSRAMRVPAAKRAEYKLGLSRIVLDFLVADAAGPVVD
jgi:hypothetical protein